MRGLWTIFRRELTAYFNSPIAYIFIIVFLFVSTALFLLIPPFFAFPRAEMMGFFGWLVPVLTIFVPAATMRIWAEERKENTIEMLLTFPVKPAALVLGKYLAALTFYLIALACTWTLPLMMAVLGDPDWGAVFSAYLGATLMGAMFLSLGTFISGFCRDQVIAFVLSFLVCATVSLVGWGPFVMILDGTVSLGSYGLGTMLRKLVGMTGHYLPFTRGVIELVDVVYFTLWTAVLLFLNMTYLEGRGRPRARAIFSTSVLLCLAIGATFNLLISDMSVKRFDLTENKMYTISDSSKQILEKLKVPVQVKVYITSSNKMPAELKSLQRDIVDKLDEMKIASSGKLQWKVIPMEATEVLKGAEDEEKDDKEKSLEERLLDKGVRPFSVRALREDQTTTQLVYSCIGVAYKEKEEEIIPQVMPGNLYQLEYRLMSTVYKLTREKIPTVVLVAPMQAVDIPPQLMQMYLQRGMTPPRTEDPYIYLQRVLEHEKFEVRRVKLTSDDPMPDEYDALFVVGVRNLDERQKWEINRAIAEGKPTLLAVQKYRWDYSAQRNTVSATKQDDNPGVNDFLKASGIGLNEDILMDNNHQAVTISNASNPLERMFGGGVTLKLPMHIVVNPSSMNPDISITNRLGQIFYLWGSALKIDDKKIRENKLDVAVLMSTSPVAWTVPPSTKLGDAARTAPEDASQMPLAILAKGQFADGYAGKKRPSWPKITPSPGMPPPPPEKEEGEAAPLSPKPGKLIFAGCAEMFNKNSLSRSNMDFFMNCTDALTLGEELIYIRSKKPIDRTIDKPSTAARSFWKFMTFVLMNIVVAAAGLSRALIRQRSRQRYYRAALAKGA